MRTRITDLFGIEHPIIQGGMHYVGLRGTCIRRLERWRARHHHGPDTIARRRIWPQEIARCHDMTDQPFGVNLTFLPGVFTNRRTIEEYMRRDHRGRRSSIVETAGRNPAKWRTCPRMKQRRHQDHP